MKKRLTFLAILTFLSGFLYVPFLRANEKNVTDLVWLYFPIGSILGALVFSWLGLKLADKANLPMPILRKWEVGKKIGIKDLFILKWSIYVSLAFGTLTIILNNIFSTPDNPGTFLMRILTTPWASIFTETISHLFILTGVFILTKDKWGSILISSLVFFLLFHFSGIEADINVVIYLGLINFTAATLTGWFYTKYGFESAVIGHAIMHFLIIGAN